MAGTANKAAATRYQDHTSPRSLLPPASSPKHHQPRSSPNTTGTLEHGRHQHQPKARHLSSARDHTTTTEMEQTHKGGLHQNTSLQHTIQRQHKDIYDKQDVIDKLHHQSTILDHDTQQLREVIEHGHCQNHQLQASNELLNQDNVLLRDSLIHADRENEEVALSKFILTREVRGLHNLCENLPTTDNTCHLQLA